MAITSNLESRGLKVVDGTTLIVTQAKKKEVKRHKFIQALVCPDTHKALRRLALEQDTTLAKLLQEVIEFYLTEKGGCKLCQEKRN